MVYLIYLICLSDVCKRLARLLRNILTTPFSNTKLDNCLVYVRSVERERGPKYDFFFSKKWHRACCYTSNIITWCQHPIPGTGMSVLSKKTSTSRRWAASLSVAAVRRSRGASSVARRRSHRPSCPLLEHNSTCVCQCENHHNASAKPHVSELYSLAYFAHKVLGSPTVPPTK